MGGLSVSGTWPVPTFSHRIASSSPAAMVGVGGRCGVVGVGVPSLLNAARPCRLLIRFLSSSDCRFASASRFMPGVALVPLFGIGDRWLRLAVCSPVPVTG